MSVLGAMLTGGQSTRMGVDKSAVVVGDSTMADRVGAALDEACDGVVSLGGEVEGRTMWPDEFTVSGPLAGLATAMRRTSHDLVVLVAVDNPFVRVDLLRHLIEAAGDLPIVPVDEHGVRQVTCAVYPASLGDIAGEEAEAGGSIQGFLDRVSFVPATPDIWRAWGEDGRSWFSVDTPEALAEGLARYG